jgi:hypothetical protein
MNNTMVLGKRPTACSSRSRGVRYLYGPHLLQEPGVDFLCRNNVHPLGHRRRGCCEREPGMMMRCRQALILAAQVTYRTYLAFIVLSLYPLSLVFVYVLEKYTILT